MALGKQITEVQFQFTTGAGTVSKVLKIQNMDIQIMHEREGGGALFTKSLDGTIIPYPVKARYKFNLTFDTSIDSSGLRDLFNSFITANKSGNTIKFWANYTGTSQQRTNTEDVGWFKVWLDKEMEYMINYQNTIGVFVPQISLITEALKTTIVADLQAP